MLCCIRFTIQLLFAELGALTSRYCHSKFQGFLLSPYYSRNILVPLQGFCASLKLKVCVSLKVLNLWKKQFKSNTPRSSCDVDNGCTLEKMQTFLTSILPGNLITSVQSQWRRRRGGGGGQGGQLPPQLLVSMGWICLCPP